MATKANNKRIWTVRINFRWNDISFQFTDAEEAAVFAQNALDHFAPHYSDFYNERVTLGARIEIISPEDNDARMQKYLAAIEKTDEQ